MSDYYSQHGEDRWIEENLNPTIGTFCEVGAYDGVKSSNTLRFEQLGWRGMLVEADPYLASQCQHNRKAVVASCAAGSRAGVADFFINGEDRGLSGMTRPGERIRVLVNRLEMLLNYAHLTDLDLLSIDTEGTELDVWASIGSIRPKIVIMEYRTCDEPPQDREIVMQMEKDGYRERHRTPCNLIFTR